MRIKKFRHTGVKPDGTFEGRKLGAVEVDGSHRISRGEGCGTEGCNCSPGIFVCDAKPRTPEGVVEGTTTYFNTIPQLDAYLAGLETQ